MSLNLEIKKPAQIFSGIFLPILFFNSILLIFLKDKLPLVTDFVSSYSPLAINLINEKGFTLNGTFCTHFPPLFPLLLAGCYKFSGIWGIQNPLYPILIVLMQSISCIIFYRLAQDFTGQRSAWMGVWLLASYPFFVVLTATRYAWTAMPLALFFFINAVSLFLSGLKMKKEGFFCSSGLFLSLAALTWGGMAYSPLVFLLYAAIFFYKERKVILFCLLFILGFMLPTGSWSLYAAHKTGKKMFVSSAASASMIDGLIRHDDSKLRSYATVQRAKEKREKGEIQTSRDVIFFYQSEIRKFPLDFMKWAFYKASRAWYGTDSEKHEKLNLLLQLPYLLLGGYGLFLGLKEKKNEVWLFSGLIFYFWSISFLVLTTIRYMMPAFMLGMMFSAYGAGNFFKRIQH